mgnify:CR=1 FL=1
MNWLVGPETGLLATLAPGLCLPGTCCSDSCYCAHCSTLCYSFGPCTLYCRRGPNDPML